MYRSRIPGLDSAIGLLPLIGRLFPVARFNAAASDNVTYCDSSTLNCLIMPFPNFESATCTSE